MNFSVGVTLLKIEMDGFVFYSLVLDTITTACKIS